MRWVSSGSSRGHDFVATPAPLPETHVHMNCRLEETRSPTNVSRITLGAILGGIVWAASSGRHRRAMPAQGRRTSQMAPSGGTVRVAEAGWPCHGSSTAVTVPRLPTPDPA